MIKKHTISFKNAWAGLRWAFSTQPNFKVHVVLSALALCGAWGFKITYAETLIVLVLITFGLAMEMINTAVEEATDAIDTSIREDIRIAKDVAAGAMLTYAVGAAVIAGLIFIPRILNLLG